MKRLPVEQAVVDGWHCVGEDETCLGGGELLARERRVEPGPRVVLRDHRVAREESGLVANFLPRVKRMELVRRATPGRSQKLDTGLKLLLHGVGIQTLHRHFYFLNGLLKLLKDPNVGKPENF